MTLYRHISAPAGRGPTAFLRSGDRKWESGTSGPPGSVDGPSAQSLTLTLSQIKIQGMVYRVIRFAHLVNKAHLFGVFAWSLNILHPCCFCNSNNDSNITLTESFSENGTVSGRRVSEKKPTLLCCRDQGRPTSCCFIF